MASCSSFSQLLSLFFIFLLLRSGFSADPDTQARINKICYQVEEYGFCNAVFHQDLSGPADFVQLTGIANDETLRNATNSLALIVQLISQTKDPALGSALQTCESGFTIVKQAFQQGVWYYGRKDYDSMLKEERIAPRAQGSCDVIFDTPPAKQNPLAETNREMRILIAMAMVAGNQLLTP